MFVDYCRNTQPRFQFIVMNRRNTGLISFTLLVSLAGDRLFCGTISVCCRDCWSNEQTNLMRLSSLHLPSDSS